MFLSFFLSFQHRVIVFQQKKFGLIVGRGVAGTSPHASSDWAKKPCQVLRRRGNKHSDGRPGPHSFTIITLFIHPHAQPTRSIAPDPRHASQFKEGSRFVEFRHRIASHRTAWTGLVWPACLSVLPCLHFCLSEFVNLLYCYPGLVALRASACLSVCPSGCCLAVCHLFIYLSACLICLVCEDERPVFVTEPLQKIKIEEKNEQRMNRIRPCVASFLVPFSFRSLSLSFFYLFSDQERTVSYK